MTGMAFSAVLAFASMAGVTTFFAPCAFPLLPGYVGYYLHESNDGTSALPVAVAAAVGALATLAALAVLVVLPGIRVKQSLPVLEPVIGIGLVVFGLLVVLERGPELRIPLPGRPSSASGFLVFGAVYAVAAAGCVVPLLAGVLTQALALPAGQGVLTVLAYALGVALPLAGVTLLIDAGVDVWRGLGVYARCIDLVAGIVLVVAGVGQVWLSVFELGVL